MSALMGCSQGGGGALLLASLFRGRGVRCAADDVPFLTDFRGAAGAGAYVIFTEALKLAPDPAAAWQTAGLSTLYRTCTGWTCPSCWRPAGRTRPAPHERSKPSSIACQARGRTPTPEASCGYTPQFVPLASAWFRLYA